MSPHLEYLPRDSNGDWTIPATCQADARDKLLRVVCPDCRDELTIEDADGKRIVAGLEDVMGTSCGLEWAYHDGSGVVLYPWGEHDPTQDEPEIEVPA